MTNSDEYDIDDVGDNSLDERFADWVDGRLSPEDLAQLEDELSSDDDLRAAADEYRKLVGVLQSELPAHAELDPPDDLVAQVMQEISPPAPRRSWIPILGSTMAAAAMLTLVLSLWDQSSSKPFAPEDKLAKTDSQSENPFSFESVEVGNKTQTPDLTPAVKAGGKFGARGKKLPRVDSGSIEKREKNVDQLRGKVATDTGQIADRKQAVTLVTGSAAWYKDKPSAQKSARAKTLAPGSSAAPPPAGLASPGSLSKESVLRESSRDEFATQSVSDLAFGYLKEVATLEEVSKRPVRARRSAGGKESEEADTGEKTKEKTKGKSSPSSSRQQTLVQAVPVLIMDLSAKALPPKTDKRGAVALSFQDFIAKQSAAKAGSLAQTKDITQEMKASERSAVRLGPVMRYKWQAGDEVCLVQGSQSQLEDFFPRLRSYLAGGQISKGLSPKRVVMRVQRTANLPVAYRSSEKPVALRFILVLRRSVVTPTKRK
jgi:anti-sigma factor RsiW